MSGVLKSALIPKAFEKTRVIVSTCNNVFKNLALEDWIFKNVVFDSRQCKVGHPELFIIWRNDPCVVMGRHQNAWTEVNIKKALRQNVDVARRWSGGGTVYHDIGNINLTFFTSRQHYNRKRNLNFIADHLKRELRLDIEVNSRDDLILNDMFKISGTAARLDGKRAYHHFTLLVNADLNRAQKLLHVSKDNMESRATSSTPSLITNLSDFRPQLTAEELIDSFVKSYSFPDKVKTEDAFVDPTDCEQFPGINEMSNKLQEWSWVYGHSPRFSVTQEIASVGASTPICLRLDVDKGHIVATKVQTGDGDFLSRYASVIGEASELLNGVRYWAPDLECILQQIPHHAKSDVAWLKRLFVTSALRSLER